MTPPKIMESAVRKVCIVGLNPLAHNLGLVLRGYGRHQVIRVADSIPLHRIPDLPTEQPDNAAIHPDPETRALMKDLGPLPITTFEMAVRYSDFVYLAGIPPWRVPALLSSLDHKRPMDEPPVPVVWLSEIRHNWNTIRSHMPPRAAALRGYQWVPLAYPTRRATSLLNPAAVQIWSDHPEVCDLTEEIWRTVTNTAPVVRGKLSL